MKKIKVGICLIVLLLIIISGSQVKAAETAKITLTSTISEKEVKIKVTATGYTNGISGIMGSLTYDNTVLKYKSISSAEDKWQTPSINETTGTFTALINKTITESTTEIAEITFERISTEATSTNIGVKDITIANKNDEEISLLNASIEVSLPVINVGDNDNNDQDNTDNAGNGGDTEDAGNIGNNDNNNQDNTGNNDNSGKEQQQSGIQKDETTANKVLAQTGITNNAIIAIIIVGVIGIIFFVNYRKYKII